ncbi:MAG: redoxin domain-containing protein, partial [Bacteroidales bacterium]|nr:redoxin domain-containing protein [Bacteroidales bacterium]
RSKNIYNIVIKGMRNTRTPRERVLEIPEDKISESGLIDISLRNLKGEKIKLSEQKGKVILLDFTIYQSANSTPHNYMLRDLYDQFASQGFNIYQVSLDADEHYWKTIADNLPWICVRDENGVYSTIASLYNVTEIPSFFLIGRDSELKKRGEDIKDIATEIKKLL